MSKTASKNLIIPEPSEELIVSEPWTMDTYADGLMDELFSDIDCILDRKGHLSKQIVQPTQQLILHQATLPEVVPPPTIISPIQKAEQRRIEAQLDSVLRGKAPKTAKVKKSRRLLWRNLGQILKVGAGVGLAIAAINWAISNGFLNRLTSKSLQFALQEPALQQKVIEASNSAPTQTQIRTDLADYMLGALEIIDRQQDSKELASANNIAIATPVPANQATLAYANQPVANLPAPKIANNAKPSIRNTRVVERIYIPVYQAPQPMRYAPPAIAQAPAPTPLPPVNTASKGVAPKPSDGTKKAAPVKVQLAKAPEKMAAFASIREIKPVAVKNKPVSVKQAPEIPKMKQAATIAPSPEVSTAPVEKPVEKEQKVASVPTSAHVLEGLLELGEQSAALFKVNGVSRRVQKGESIGASGWTLVDVANGEAIIRRNGEVRSIFAGQKF
ncbi:hypothetical protein [Calothrix sp. CCY 0018]|uniref:hypothetical protein n=1 Tax=Calothrix sp. CCY 0018 TaxID=3103864 RepID=UPI0039C67584